MFNILNQIDLTKIFDPSQVFQATPDPVGLYLYGLVVYGLALIGAVILGNILRRNPRSIYKKLWRQFIYLMLFAGLTGPILVFFRWQSIPYIGSRLMVLVLWIIAIAWLIQIMIYWFRVLPQEIKKIKEKENFERFLPSRKNK